MSDYLASRRLLVTGGSGLVGSALTRVLREIGVRDLSTPTSRECDLTEALAVHRLFARVRPQVVIHAAGLVGGIEMNRRRPGEVFYANLIMGTLLMEHARRAGVERFVGVGTVCSYPKHAAVPFREETLWDGYPEETNAAYGIAKKAWLEQSRAYHAQWSFQAVNPIVVNTYGPGDDFSLEESHVIPALIRKTVEAKEQRQPLVVWGSGTATREFIFVDDAARAILLATERLSTPEPLNIGSGHEISIRDLVTTISRIVGFVGEVRFDRTRPDGQPRRCLDVRRAERLLGFRAEVGLEEGIGKTVAWYLEHRETANRGRHAAP